MKPAEKIKIVVNEPNGTSVCEEITFEEYAKSFLENSLSIGSTYERFDKVYRITGATTINGTYLDSSVHGSNFTKKRIKYKKGVVRKKLIHGRSLSEFITMITAVKIKDL